MIVQFTRKDLLSIEVAVRCRRQAAEENAQCSEWDRKEAKEWLLLEEKIMKCLQDIIKRKK